MMVKRMVYSLAAPLFAGERFELTVRVIDYRYISIDYENTVREAARSVNAKTTGRSNAKRCRSKPARAVYNSTEDFVRAAGAALPRSIFRSNRTDPITNAASR
jgi:hypothetical protein